jgi:predicted nucleotidyltransferase
MKIKCPACGKAGYIRLIAKERKWDDRTLIATIQFEIRVDHEKLSCQIAPFGEAITEMRRSAGL